LHAAAANRVYDMTYPAYVVRHSREEALQARADMGEVATCALCIGKINPDSPSAVVCASGNNIIHYACGVLAFALPSAPTFNLDCQCLLAEDPAEGETEAPVCVGFSVCEVRAASLKDGERMQEAVLRHERQVNDVLLERRAAEGDSRAMVMPNVEAQVIAVIILGLPAMPFRGADRLVDLSPAKKQHREGVVCRARSSLRSVRQFLLRGHVCCMGTRPDGRGQGKEPAPGPGPAHVFRPSPQAVR
jgi:hypothetical protein